MNGQRRAYRHSALAVARVRTRVRRIAAMGGLLAAVGGLVTVRSTVAPPASQALSATGMAAPVAPAHPARTHRHHKRTAAPATPSKPPTHSVAPSPAHARHTAKPAPARREVTGAAFNVGYGVVQVRVTLLGSRMTDVTPLSLPQGGRSSDISSYAAPRLRNEALAAQSARIDAVSGASYTSAGYAKSLQSALDRARA